MAADSRVTRPDVISWAKLQYFISYIKFFLLRFVLPSYIKYYSTDLQIQKNSFILYKRAQYGYVMITWLG